MALTKISETYIHQETGIRGTVTPNGKIAIQPQHGDSRKGFVFINSNKETVVKVCEAILELAAKITAQKKIPKSQQF